MVKPFDVEEVLARLRALLRPVGGAAGELVVGDRRLVVGEQRLVGGDGEVMLSGREARLLETLARRPDAGLHPGRAARLGLRQRRHARRRRHVRLLPAPQAREVRHRDRARRRLPARCVLMGLRSKTAVAVDDPLRRASRSVALRVGATTALVVLLAIVGTAVLFDRQQLAEIRGRTETTARTADDVVDAPPGTWLVKRTESGQEATRSMPPDLAAAVAGIGPDVSGQTSFTAQGRSWPAWVDRRDDGSYVAVYDIRLHTGEEQRLLMSTAAAGRRRGAARRADGPARRAPRRASAR